MKDDLGALSVVLNESRDAAGLLAGAAFVVKENIGVAGQISTNGHPLWATTHAPADENAPIIDQLLGAGARLVGKTHMDEMAYSLLGANPHFGTPINPAAQDRYPGGSSSGSAVAVAAGLVNFALGTDTAGSCRAPASFCGVFGFRSTNGAVSTAGVVPLAPSFDAIGWFARDIDVMASVGDILLPHDTAQDEMIEPVFLENSFDGVEMAFSSAASTSIDQLKSHATWRDFRFDEDFFKSALMHFRNLQAFEAWTTHGAWISEHHPSFGKGVEERFAYAGQVTLKQSQAAEIFREEARPMIEALFGARGFLVVPTTPFRSPLLDESEEQLDAKRYQMMRIFLIASYFGLPQISLPLQVGGAPMGLSFIGPRGCDRKLIELARRFFFSIKKSL